ncbi:DUF177 domain-containing protein [Ahrensia sp. R2A130]|uniref:YceD family protein n=1 Tax=Ahrensia sp. R2A130 TaxID=744979 RepID=UPI0001E083B4|nr:DUF177 domain-containing protein [Ahrensia sp. R2A130]EFL90520.1 putative cytoplasmic protein [Ahrensia sp. R2A130]
MSDLPFSVPVNVRTLPSRGRVEDFTADDDQRAAIAEDQGLIEVKSFHGFATVTPWKKDGVMVQGKVRGNLVQACAVSGDPLTADLDEEFNAVFAPEGSVLLKPKLDVDGEIILDPEGDDPPEPFTGDSIDLAEVWLEFLALSIDPFARIEGAELDQEEAKTGETSPFAALAALKEK